MTSANSLLIDAERSPGNASDVEARHPHGYEKFTTPHSATRLRKFTTPPSATRLTATCLFLVTAVVLAIWAFITINGKSFVREASDDNVPFFRTDIPIYYINSDQSPLREQFMQLMLRGTGTVVKVPAVEVQQSPRPEVALRDVKLARSHLRAIKTAYDAGDEVAVILEDDASPILAAYWNMTLDEVYKQFKKLYPDALVIRLQYAIPKSDYKYWIQEFIRRRWATYLAPDFSNIIGTTAYMIQREGMKRLLSAGNEQFKKLGCLKDEWQCPFAKYLDRVVKNNERLKVVPPMFVYNLYEDQMDDDKNPSEENLLLAGSAADATHLAVMAFDGMHRSPHDLPDPQPEKITRWLPVRK